MNSLRGFLGMAACVVGTGASSACADHLGCAHLSGDCCPPGGPQLDCCSNTTALRRLGGPYVNNYDGQNPLGIQPNGQRSQNYFLIIGDWGRADSPGPCQRAVADHLKAYVSRQQQQGKKLLFIASVGDNFYWSGVTPGAWQASWASLYGPNDPGSPLYQVPWLSVLGNHDLGNDDPYAACADQMQAPLATVNGQRYGCEQFNLDKNPRRPGNTKLYWLPDYNYHYEIPEADLEVIAIDTNQVDIEGLGGDSRGAWKMGNMCGGQGNMENFLQRVNQAGQELLRQRAAQGTAKTVLIIQHYPGQCKKDIFLSALRPGRQVNVICAYGHDHSQRCDGTDNNGQCNMILTGGGGGCCPGVISRAGFAAVSLTDDGGYVSDVQSGDVTVPDGTCHFRRLTLSDYV